MKEARQRARRRKSPWNLILIPLAAVGGVFTAVVFARSLLELQAGFIPESAILSSYTRIGAIVMFVFVIFPSLAIGMIIANLVAWCIPPARKAFTREARGVKGASFRDAMKGLSIAAVVLLVLCIPVCLLGGMNYYYVTPDGISLNPLFSLTQRHYGWDEIREIHTRCLAERDNLHLNYRVTMGDGSTIDLMEEPRLRFARVYPDIKPFIEAQKGIIYSQEITPRGLRRLDTRYNARDAERILSVLCRE